MLQPPLPLRGCVNFYVLHRGRNLAFEVVILLLKEIFRYIEFRKSIFGKHSGFLTLNGGRHLDSQQQHRLSQKFWLGIAQLRMNRGHA